MVRRVVAPDSCGKNREAFREKQKEVSPIVTRFIKIMIGKDHTEVLYLPRKFARKVVHLANQETEIEDSNGEKWPVTFSYFDGSLSLHKGWNRFYQEHRMEMGDFVVFNYKEGSHFVVQIYGRNALERINFNKVRTRENKRPRPDPPAFPQEEEPLSGSDSRKRKTDPVEKKNADVADLTCMIDLTCMVDRDNVHYEREDRGFLFDLSNFEMKKEALDANKIVGPVQMDVEINKLDTNEESSRAEMDVICEGDLGNGFGGEIAPRDAEFTVDATPIKGEEIAPCYAEFTVDATPIKGEEVAPCHAQITADATRVDVHSDKFLAEPSDKSNSCKNAIDNIISSFRDVLEKSEVFAEKEYASPFASSALKDLFGKCAIKKELVEVEDIPDRFLGVSCDAEKVTSAPLVVKPEPDLLYDAVPFGAIGQFSAVVKSLSFLELPIHIPSHPLRRESGYGKFVRVRDPMGRHWMILNPALFSLKALTGNWTEFCLANGIKLGDECRFQPENDNLYTYRVDIVRH
ncbi:hypothetical protein ACP275_04G128400 [Erythranthe tilingii]